MQDLQTALETTAQQLFKVSIKSELTRPEEKHGDFSSNMALKLAAELGKPPREVADALVAQLSSNISVSKVEVAGPGFINIRLTDAALASTLKTATDIVKTNTGKQILVEFGDPNPFKEMHIGHLYDAIVGDAITSLLSRSGAEVVRLSYHGDVGMQVAMWLWAIHKRVGWDTAAARAMLVSTTDSVIGEIYAEGAQSYKNDKQAAVEIQSINHQVYDASNPAINEMYELGRSISLEKFNDVFNKLGIDYQKHYLESQSTPIGVGIVNSYKNKVFTESDGAIVYEGEKVGLHTRVFITSKGNPTYETKDLGLVELKAKDYPKASRSIVITGAEQSEYFKVMLAALKEINPKQAIKTNHMTHGFVNLSTGKMSSRTGDVYGATRLLETVNDEVKQQYPDSKAIEDVYLAAIKYALLKNRMGPDIVLDVEESVSLDGKSGPYLQYAYARARGIIRKSSAKSEIPDNLELDAAERTIVRIISLYAETVEKSIEELLPHYIATYLFDLSQAFNRFYESSRIVGHDREALRLKIVEVYAEVLKDGLELLGISAPEQL